MRKKIKILSYECKKCNKYVYFRSNEEYTTQCKTCKNEMRFCGERNYNPKNGLRAVEYSNTKLKTNFNISTPTKPVVECPYCHSKNTKKISGLSKAGSVALFGIFAAGKVSKQFHCNQCGADF